MKGPKPKISEVECERVITVRMPSSLHAAIAILAKQSSKSINQFVINAINKDISAYEAHDSRRIATNEQVDAASVPQRSTMEASSSASPCNSNADSR